MNEHQAENRVIVTANERLLLVDDSNAVATLLGGVLRDAFAMPIDHARSLVECRPLLEKNGRNYVAAIVDVGLPDAPNAEALDVVGATGIPTIALTASMDDQVYQRVAFRPIVDYIVKTMPAAPQALVRVLRCLMRNSERHVLLVDDSQTFREYLAPILRQQALRVSTAANVTEARAAMEREFDIALVVLDHEMPGGNGIDFCAELRSRWPLGELGVVGITGSTDPFIPVRFLKCGADDVLRKPFLAEEFVSRVNACLDHLDTVRRMHEQAHRDFLTGLYNRRHLFDSGATLFANAARDNVSLTVAMIDVDNFKPINDRYGHDAGDQVLIAMANILTASFRAGDLIARTGGEEFCVVAVNSAKPAVLMERLRQRVEQATVHLRDAPVDKLRFTISVGYTTRLDNDLAAMIRAADAALYRAKDGGRNRVIAAD